MGSFSRYEKFGDEMRCLLLCWGYVWGGQHVRFGWHLWPELMKLCFFILLCIFRFTGKSRASRCGPDCHVSGGGHLRRQFRWESWWCKNWGSVQLLYSVISVHVFAILVYNEDRGWGKVIIWCFVLFLSWFVFGISSGVNCESRLRSQPGFEAGLGHFVAS